MKSINIKVVVIGETGVGKSTLVKRLVDNVFSDTICSTIGAAFQILKLKTTNGQAIALNIWDTAGQERFNSLLPMYYRDSEIILYVYNVNNITTFDRVVDIYNQIKADDKLDLDNTIPILIGSKIDMCDNSHYTKVSKIKTFVQDNNMIWLTVSSKLGTGIDSLKDSILDALIKYDKITLDKTKTSEIKSYKSVDILNNNSQINPANINNSNKYKFCIIL